MCYLSKTLQPASALHWHLEHGHWSPIDCLRSIQFSSLNQSLADGHLPSYHGYSKSSTQPNQCISDGLKLPPKRSRGLSAMTICAYATLLSLPFPAPDRLKNPPNSHYNFN